VSSVGLADTDIRFSDPVPEIDFIGFIQLILVILLISLGSATYVRETIRRFTVFINEIKFIENSFRTAMSKYF